MIGFTKLLCGTATISEVMRQRHGHEATSAGLLQFSSERSPVVVWNITSQCNLKCRHCYIEATESAKENEVTTEEGKAFIDDLAEMKVPVLITGRIITERTIGLPGNFHLIKSADDLKPFI